MGVPPASICATVAALEWLAAVVLSAPLVAPVKVVELVPVYVIVSESIIIVPVESKDEVLDTGIVVSSSSTLLVNVVVTVSSSCRIK